MVQSCTQNPALQDLHILVVDDEPANLKLLRLMLQHAGYRRISLLDDPRQVTALCQAEPPDLILLDINMPHLDGFGVMGQIKALGLPLACPIVVLTAQCGQDLLLRALQNGANDFLNKPFNRQELLARVHNLLTAQLARQRLQADHASLEQAIENQTREVQRLQADVVRRLARASELRDNETGAHVLRMSHTSALLAKQMGWSDSACALLLEASPMHDVGKIGIPDGILLKPGPLTTDERTIMQTHTTVGAALLTGSDDPLLSMARDIALCHHEKWDGTGYPSGLTGTAIPEAARIVAIADVFDALTSERPYKQAWPVPDAVQFMQNQAGKHFDPDILAGFLGIIPQVQAIRLRHTEPASPPPGTTQAVEVAP